MRTQTQSSLLAALALAACCTLTFAQTQPPDPLAGPTVNAVQAPPTLVIRDFSGVLTRPQVAPEEAATRLLTLSEAEQTAVSTVLNERAAIYDRAIQNNYDLLLKLQGFKEMPGNEKLALLRDWNVALKELKAHGKLIDELAASLTPANAAQLRSMVKEYRNATLADAIKNPGNEKSLRPGQIAARENLQEMGHELKRSFDRRLADGQANLNDILSKIDATPQQRDAIQRITMESFQQTKANPNAQQKQDLFRKVLETLTPQQRRTLVQEYFQTNPKTTKPQARATQDKPTKTEKPNK